MTTNQQNKNNRKTSEKFFKDKDYSAQSKPAFRNRWIKAVYETPEISSSAVFVAFLINSHINAKTGEVFPSYDALAERGKLSPRTVGRAVSELASLGLINIHKGFFGKHSHNIYQLVVMSSAESKSAGSSASEGEKEEVIEVIEESIKPNGLSVLPTSQSESRSESKSENLEEEVIEVIEESIKPNGLSVLPTSCDELPNGLSVLYPSDSLSYGQRTLCPNNINNKNTKNETSFLDCALPNNISPNGNSFEATKQNETQKEKIIETQKEETNETQQKEELDMFKVEDSVLLAAITKNNKNKIVDVDELMPQKEGTMLFENECYDLNESKRVSNKTYDLIRDVL